MRIVFMGTPEFAVPTLERLAREVTAVVCQPDRAAGRKGEVQAPAVKQAAERLGLSIYQPARMRGDEAVAWLEAQRPDALAVVAYGQILPASVFNLPKWGAINAHASLLPAYRGAAPIQWAVANGEERTGVTTMRINAGLDTGDMLLRQEVPIAPEETAAALSRRLAQVAASLMVETLRGLEAGDIRPAPQPEEGTLAPRLSRASGLVDWTLPAERIHDRWRGFQPWPGIHSRFRGQQITVVACRPLPGGGGAPGTLVEVDDLPAVVCGAGRLRLDQVRLEGRATAGGAEFARGARIAWGAERLSA